MKKYIARRKFGYGTHGELSTGQVVALSGLRNDEKLVALGYFEEYSGKTVTCGQCGAEFDTDDHRTVHGTEKHGGKG